VTDLLDRILALTVAIEGHVDAGDWPGAAALDRDRRGLLAELLAGQPPGLDGRARGVLEELLARHRATLAHVTTERDALGGALRALNAAPAAVQAYSRAAESDRRSLAGSELP
jgi:hypothetical protein